MIVLHIVAGELVGGAARGAYWLHKGLLALGVDSRILCDSSVTYGDASVLSLAAGKKGKLLSLLRREADGALKRIYKGGKNITFSTGLFGYDFTRTAAYHEADIVHLHWICGGMVNMRHLGKAKKPIIWTMRDMWPMTGGCHCSMGCQGYLARCGQCPQLGSRYIWDLSRFVLMRKKKIIPQSITLVGISHWLSECARRSALFQKFDVRTIHNNVNASDFFPVDKKLARQILGIPQNRPVVLAGAQNLYEFHKGFDLYLQALHGLTLNPFLVFFGNFNSDAVASLKCDYLDLGFMYDTVSLRIIYSAADVFVAPSRMDAFGKTLAEAMACGTPVVCFDSTGPKDIVDHKENGYKAKPYDPKDLARGIEWVFEKVEEEVGCYGTNKNQNSENTKTSRDDWFLYLPEIGKRGREKVLTMFDTKVIAKKYIELYEEVLI